MNTFDKISDLINTYMNPEEDVKSRDTMIGDLGFDVLDYMELVINAENMIGVDVDDNKLKNLNEMSVGEFCDYLDTLPKSRKDPIFSTKQYFNKSFVLSKQH